MLWIWVYPNNTIRVLKKTVFGPTFGVKTRSDTNQAVEVISIMVIAFQVYDFFQNLQQTENISKLTIKFDFVILVLPVT